MSHRHRGDDVIRLKLGMSRVVYFIPGEDPAGRHRRRHAAAMVYTDFVRAWCESRGVTLKVTGSHHPETLNPHGWKWDFSVPGKFAQWRPFPGKLSLKTQLRGGHRYTVKVHDAEQLIQILEKWITSDGPDLF